MADKQSIPEIQDAVRSKYIEVSASAKGKFNYPTGREGAILQGYDRNIVESLKDEMVESFCGVGNPFQPGPVRPLETLLDVGCGAGFDLIIASYMVGQRGRVCGIDMTADMAKKAKKNLFDAALSDFDVRVASSESIPYDDNTFDVVISNGVLNLSPSKEKSFAEILRVLKPAGRLQFADIVRREACSPSGGNALESWSS
jgi:arsenite methyltransferase